MDTIARTPTLAALEAGEVMAPGLVACPPGAALTEVATLMCIHQVHAVVVDPGTPSVLTARDVVRGVLAGAASAAEAVNQRRRPGGTRPPLTPPLSGAANTGAGGASHVVPCGETSASRAACSMSVIA